MKNVQIILLISRISLAISLVFWTYALNLGWNTGVAPFYFFTRKRSLTEIQTNMAIAWMQENNVEATKISHIKPSPGLNVEGYCNFCNFMDRYFYEKAIIIFILLLMVTFLFYLWTLVLAYQRGLLIKDVFHFESVLKKSKEGCQSFIQTGIYPEEEPPFFINEKHKHNEEFF